MPRIYQVSGAISRLTRLLSLTESLDNVPAMKRQTLVVMYGGTQLTAPQQEMARALAREIVVADLADHGRQFVLVTGGFRVYADKPDGVSTDWAAASAAAAILEQRGVAVDTRLR
jgi:hypothetical protein